MVPAGVNPLNWARVTPELPARALNWLSKLDSSASTSVGVWTEGIWVLIFDQVGAVRRQLLALGLQCGQTGLKRHLLALELRALSL